MSEFDLTELKDSIEEESKFINDINTSIRKVIIGQNDLIEKLILAILTDGHVFLEGVPGLAKTLTINSLAKLIDTKFQRLQFTPDLLPADILGTLIYNPKEGTFEVKKGPIFANIILADEINRSPAKVQSALLEAMQERQITIGDNTFKLENPFLKRMWKINSTIDLKAVVKPEQIISARNIVDKIYIAENIQQYIVSLVFATRYPEQYGLKDLKSLISFGASPRATIFLANASKSHAFLNNRGFVIPEDVRSVGT